MFSIKPLPEFTTWLDGLKDSRVRGAVVERVKRLSFGLLGDFKVIGDGVIERASTSVRVGVSITRSPVRRLSCCLRVVPNARKRKISNGPKRIQKSKAFY